MASLWQCWSGYSKRPGQDTLRRFAAAAGSDAATKVMGFAVLVGTTQGQRGHVIVLRISAHEALDLLQNAAGEVACGSRSGIHHLLDAVQSELFLLALSFDDTSRDNGKAGVGSETDNARVGWCK